MKRLYASAAVAAMEEFADVNGERYSTAAHVARHFYSYREAGCPPIGALGERRSTNPTP
jgi:hypothetical protein